MAKSLCLFEMFKYIRNLENTMCADITTFGQELWFITKYKVWAKRVAPYQKWLTWVIVAKNNQIVNESCVFVFTCAAISKPTNNIYST